MTANYATYGDLGRLLRRLGFASRHVEVTHRNPNDAGDAFGWVVQSLLDERHGDDTNTFLPPRSAGEPAEPRHLVPTRRQLIDRGQIEEAEFDRWLCGVRFGDVCRESVAVGASDRQNGRATD